MKVRSRRHSSARKVTSQTKTGELSSTAAGAVPATKRLSAAGQIHGLRWTEARYRQRYLDPFNDEFCNTFKVAAADSLWYRQFMVKPRLYGMERR